MSNETDCIEQRNSLKSEAANVSGDESTTSHARMTQEHDFNHSLSRRPRDASVMTGDEDDPANSSTDSTPSKRNKRKMTEPRRRTTDFSIRSICSNSDTEEVGGDDVVEKSDNVIDVPADITHSPLDLVAAQRDLLRDGYFHVGHPGIPILFHAHANAIPMIIPQPVRGQTLIAPPRPSSVDSTGSSHDPGHSRDALNQDYRRHADLTSDDRSILRGSISRGQSPDSRSTSNYGADSPTPGDSSSQRLRKNYKNMTKQRRIEANARERTRVHTISAAFESLRRAVPSYSYNQRLSKLAILRIACSYILALARLAELDYSEEQEGMEFSECVEICTQTIQAEGKAKRKH